MKHFLIALFLAVGIHALTFGALFAYCLAHALGSTPPYLLLAYGDSSVEGFDVDVVAPDPGTESYGMRMKPGGAASVAPEMVQAPAEPPLPALEAPPATEALPAEESKPAVVEEALPTPSASVLEPPPTYAALNSAVVSAATIRPSNSSTLASGAPLPKGTPSRGGTVGSRSGVRMIGLPRPTYPRDAVLRGLEGRVVLHLRISAEGKVTEVKVHESSGHKVLDEAALEFGRTLVFIPAHEEQQAVSATALYPVRYSLVDATAGSQR